MGDHLPADYYTSEDYKIWLDKLSYYYQREQKSNQYLRSKFNDKFNELFEST